VAVATGKLVQAHVLLVRLCAWYVVTDERGKGAYLDSIYSIKVEWVVFIHRSVRIVFLGKQKVFIHV
jgi:hypothetical protein